MKSYLICPVRGVDPATSEGFVRELEQSGYQVHWPPRDTNQVDAIGLRICRDNLEAIRNADVVHVIWNGESQGCLFDLGMTFALGKPVVVLELPPPSKERSFQNIVRAWQSELESGSSPRPGRIQAVLRQL
ncbi:MAG: nucleoside 2-deoxyribosyltransferase [Alphaproteobacteria bacterium]|nr:nucleoside 2-deoxyribosyltransferase [Alphaproteobacteria bacterium]